MNKFYLTLVGAFFALCASAQYDQFETGYRNGEWYLDSTYVINANGIRTDFEEYEYQNGRLVGINSVYMSDFEDGVPDYIEHTKTVLNHTADGKVGQVEISLKDETGTYVLSATIEFAYNGAGLVESAVYQGIDEENPDAGIQPFTKTVYVKYNGDVAEDTEFYSWDEESKEWVKYGTAHSDIVNGQIVKITHTEEMMGFSITTETTYQYDSHGYTTYEKVSTGGFGFTTKTETSYENTYDANDNIYTIKESIDGGDPTTTYHFWSREGGTSIQMVKSAIDAATQWYDISGRRLNGAPSHPGIFIHNGKKTVIRK